MASMKRQRLEEDDHDGEKGKGASVSYASELKGHHPVMLNPADCDLGISSLLHSFLFAEFLFLYLFPVHSIDTIS